MPIKLLVFMFCFFTATAPISALFVPAQNDEATMAFMDFHEAPAPTKFRRVSIPDPEWSGTMFYDTLKLKVKGISTGTTVSSIYLPTAIGVLDDKGKVEREVRLIQHLSLSGARVTPDKLDDMDFIKSIWPDQLQGCLAPADEDMLKRLLNAGYKLHMPVMVASKCKDEGTDLLSPGYLIALAIALFGSMRFLLLLRACYVVRKSEQERPDEPILPADASAGEAIRAAKAGYGRWTLLRESALDAAMHYAPAIIFLRLKEAVPKAIASQVKGSVMNAWQARKDGNFRAYLGALLREPRVRAANGLAALISVAILAQAFLPEAWTALVVIGLGIAIWATFAFYLGLGKRKALTVTFVFSMAFGAVLVGGGEHLLKEGVMLNLPFVMDAPALFHPDIHAYPLVLVTALLAFLLASYVLGGIIAYYKGKFEISIGGRNMELSEAESVSGEPAAAPEQPALPATPPGKPAVSRDTPPAS